MGGKTASAASQIQIPPEIMAQYNAVNASAEKAASKPFQSYSSDPNAFVAPLTDTQRAGIGNVNDLQGSYKPYFDAATNSLYGAQQAADPLQSEAAGNIQGGLDTGKGYLGAATNLSTSALGAANTYNNTAGQLAMGSAAAVNPTALGGADIQKFMNPYNDAVVNSTMANLRQQQQQEQSSEVGNQIKAGAFGGDRGRIAQANLARQQDLASGQVISGLEQQNYSQALGAAQQQQGVGLSAAQANRSALGAAGQSIAGLGQQVYGQRSGTAGQIASLGNQGYTQALGAANAQGALGQQVFGQGVTTSGSLASLGSGQQAAGLAGAQAQIGAGTLEQQTQQAGQSALYNQFLQEQGYPFQVAQFRAGIAEGTGALSGSTTTTTQPTSFMGGLSDARMKEDMEPVGETYDGQKIVRFRYKGQKEKKLGLVAQNVEHAHPDAVREHGGLKYVDYDRATDRAVARGHFAEGGGVGDETMAEIARIQKAMYPYGSEGQSRTGGGSGPWGAAIPQQSHKLMAAAAPKIKQENLLHDAAGIANDVDSVTKTYDGVKDMFSDKGGSSKSDEAPNGSSYDSTGGADMEGMYRGGLVRRKRRASGGKAPYAAAEDSYVPSEEDDAKVPDSLQAAKKVDFKSPNLLGDIASAAKTVKDIGSVFMKKGGLVVRKRYAGGGSSGSWDDVPDEDVDAPTSFDQSWLGKMLTHGRDTTPPFDQSGLSRADVKHLAASEDPSERLLGVKEAQRRNSGPDVHLSPEAPPPQAPALGAANTNAPPLGADINVPTRPEPKALQIDQESPPPALGAAEAPPAPPEKHVSGPDYGEPEKKTEKPGWFHRNREWLVPLLKGVGTAASSNSRYLGSALLQGAAAGAGSYMDVQQQIPKTESANIEVQQREQGLEKSDVYTDPNGNTMVRMPNGTSMPYYQWRKLGQPPTLHQKQEGHGVAQAGVSDEAQPATGDAYAIGQAGRAAIEHMPEQWQSAPLDQKASLRKMSSEREEQVTSAAVRSNEANTQNRKLVATILQQPNTGGWQPGALEALRSSALSRWNDIVTTVGQPELRIDPNAQDLAAEVNKMTKTGGFSLADQASQHSLSALETAISANPGNPLPKSASLGVVAKLLTDHQINIDEALYLQNMRHALGQTSGGDTSSYQAHVADRAFQSDHSSADYVKEQKALTEIFQKATDPSNPAAEKNSRMLNKMLSGQVSREKIDEVGRAYGVKNLSRYFLGGQ